MRSIIIQMTRKGLQLLLLRKEAGRTEMKPALSQVPLQEVTHTGTGVFVKMSNGKCYSCVILCLKTLL